MNLRLALSILLVAFACHANANLGPVPETARTELPDPEIAAKSWILADFDTGWILAGKNADLKIEPASLTKIMTSYIVFSALESGRIKEDDMVYVSKKAWKTGGSRMFIEVDTHVSVMDLLRGLIVQSGNDAAVALAEHVSGSEEQFVKEMNLVAKELGMTNTHFRNSSGLPMENNYSSVLDITLLTIDMIRQFPEYYKLYSELEFTYNNIKQHNRNVLLTRDSTVDGVKTGYTREAGYCLVGTAVRDGFRLVGAVAGSKSRSKRANQVQALLRYGFSSYMNKALYVPGEAIETVRLWGGNQKHAKVGVKDPVKVLLPNGQDNQVSYVSELPSSMKAPVEKGEQVGKFQVRVADEAVLHARLYAIEDYPAGPLHLRIRDSVLQYLAEWFQ